eukprot:1141995-Pelagomonas_calceolata.AAC.1
MPSYLLSKNKVCTLDAAADHKHKPASVDPALAGAHLNVKDGLRFLGPTWKLPKRGPVVDIIQASY